MSNAIWRLIRMCHVIHSLGNAVQYRSVPQLRTADIVHYSWCPDDVLRLALRQIYVFLNLLSKAPIKPDLEWMGQISKLLLIT
ncbi:hypothetical protein MA16_Dca021729 [Dendrobium catenatum]|uniref:Uncharacterized protein n=1 Tax=Dendrobium catenatum TaxID=906689 RepID=A0A2I0WVD2_9ASPA|nr:hypothetical protein MA16_Dca021729 [Dendrobium catenatum]